MMLTGSSIVRRVGGAMLLALTSVPALAGGDVRLQGAGATFPNPLYQKWVVEYQKAHPDVKIDYQSIGSGGGIKSITEKTVQFAGSDAPLNKKEIEALGGPEKVVQFPSCAGAVVPAYNLPGFEGELKLSGDVIADIFLGKIAKWNDARITAANPGAKLPDTAITTAWRTDGSGTTYVFTNYLATQSAEFKSSVGTGKQVKWPVGQGGKGNEGVAAAVQQTAGGIGYIEVNYARANKIAYASVKNTNGKFVKATPETISAAGEGAVAGLKGSLLAADIWNQAGDNSYPIAAFTYLIVYRDLYEGNVQSPEEAKALLGFFKWAVQDGQKFAASMDYAPLSDGVRKAADTAISALTWKGSPVR